MRILAVDWGEVRIGVSVSDPSGKIAFPLDKIVQGENGHLEIKKIVEELKVEKIIIGLPKNLSGGSSESTRKTENFVTKLKEQVIIPLELIDERFTSVEAGKRLTEQGLNQQEQRGIKDNIAAQIMLQQYLDTNNKSN